MWRHDVMPNVIAYNAAIRVRKGLAAPAGFSSLTSGSAPRHRAGGDHQQRSISACEKSRLHQQAWHLVRMMCRHGIVPNVITCNAAIRTRTGAAAPAGFHPLRAVQRHAIGPTMITNNAASVRAKRTGCTSRPGISYERCGGMTSCRT